MSDKTGIEWTDATWNPIRGCSRISEGCRNCYAESVAYRFSGPGQPYEGLVRIGADGKRRREWNGNVQFVERHLLDPLKWKSPRSIFVNSMSDLFHPNVKDEWIDKVFAVMALCPPHTFQVLTKRPERMLEYFASFIKSSDAEQRAWNTCAWAAEAIEKPVPEWIDLIASIPRGLSNVHLGVSCENQETKHRIDTLRQTPAAVRFLSLEPLIEDLGELNLEGIHWVIVGGESGPGARPCDANWIRSIVQQCNVASVPCFVKQLGSRPCDRIIRCTSYPVPVHIWTDEGGGSHFVPHLSDKKGGDIEEFPVDLRVREFPA